MRDAVDGSPKVTVIIPAYNAQATISETLESVSAQTWKNIEIIVVDDGSADKTADIVRAHGRVEPRLRLLEQKNQGVATARNAGLRLAAGQYAAWLDADDLWRPTKLEKQLEIFSASTIPLGFVYTGYRLIDERQRILTNPRTLVDISGDTLCRQIATTYFTNVSSLMAPVALARRCGGHDPRLRAWGIEGAEDLLLQLKLAALAPVGCCHEALVGYRIHANNMSRAIGRAAQSNIKVLELVAELEPEVPDWVFRLGRARTVGFGLQMIAAGSIGDGLSFLAQRLRDDPAMTLVTLAQSAIWLGRQALGMRPVDRAVGDSFDEADPATVPWEAHMLLSAGRRALLDQADMAARARTRLSQPPA